MTVHEAGSHIYVAHKFLKEHENLEKVQRLVAWLNECYNCLFYAPWVPMALHSNKHEEWQLERDFEWVRSSSGLFIFNTVGSRGVERERQVAFEYLGASRILDFGGLSSIDQITPYYQGLLELHYGRRRS